MEPAEVQQPGQFETLPSDAPVPGCSVGQSIRRFFAGYVKFSGRASRSEFWNVVLPLAVVTIGLPLMAGSFYGQSEAMGSVLLLLALVIRLALFLPFLSLAVRRLHDIDSSGFKVLFALVPLLGLIALLIHWLLPSDPAGVRFDRRIYRTAENQP